MSRLLVDVMQLSEQPRSKGRVGENPGIWDPGCFQKQWFGFMISFFLFYFEKKKP